MNNGYNGNDGRFARREGQKTTSGQRQVPRGQSGAAPRNARTEPKNAGRQSGTAPKNARTMPKNAGRQSGVASRSARAVPRNIGGQSGMGQRSTRGQLGKVETRRTRPVSGVRRKATREQMRAENRRRRREGARLFLGRLALYGVMLLVLGGIAAGIFFGFFYSAPDANEASIDYFENFNGDKTVKSELSGTTVYRNGKLYVNFSSIADGCNMSTVLDSKTVRFVLSDGDDVSDSAGTGHEEYVSFVKDSTECVVCGQTSRLTSPAYFVDKRVWIPADFVNDYVNGITVTEEKSAGKVYVMRDKEESDGGDDKDAAPLAEVSFKLKAAVAPENPELSDGQVSTGGISAAMPKVDFSADLSEYEQYMEPVDSSEYLKLVNKTNTVDASLKPDDLTEISATRNDGRATQTLRYTAAKALEAMFIEMRMAGYTDVSVTSAYRSYEYQSELYNTYTNNEMAKKSSLTKAQAQAIVDTYSARPGTSEHQTGLCCDLHNLPSADVAFADQPAYGWLKENAWKFGFILRFPEDKTDITGYSFEPWHYRFVGRTAAWQIYSGGLCLEEYLQS